MTRQEWLDQAEEWDRKAAAAAADGNETWAEYCDVKARACRYIAPLGVEDDADD